MGAPLGAGTAHWPAAWVPFEGKVLEAKAAGEFLLLRHFARGHLKNEKVVYIKIETEMGIKGGKWLTQPH